MLVQVSPVAKNSGESQCTLSFAQRVRSVELGSAKKKVETAEIAALRERLSQYEVGLQLFSFWFSNGCKMKVDEQRKQLSLKFETVTSV